MNSRLLLANISLASNFSTTSMSTKLTATVVTLFNNLNQIKKSPGITSSGFSHYELKTYSILLNLIVAIGFIFHSFVLFILIYQQVKRHKAKKQKRLEQVNMEKEANKPSRTSNLYKIQKSLDTSLNHESSQAISGTFPSKLGCNHTNKSNMIQLNRDYNNYVTYAFVFHQTVVDLLRLLYTFLYANRIYNDYQLQDDILNDVNHSNSALNIFYEKYCTQMASFYSVLTMVTIVNILTILVSETCRYYDLKFNTSDTSNYCCVIFGIMLIWISSLIIISSLMLVGVVDSAAPTWNCETGETESSTRSLVINIVWFLLVAFILMIAFSYSISLYKELNSFNDQEIYYSMSVLKTILIDEEVLARHSRIVKETKKRLFILTLLAVLFCATFLPNFITTVLKNSVHSLEPLSLKPYDLISCIVNLSNSSLNAIILLILCIKSNDTCLTNIIYLNAEEDEIEGAYNQQEINRTTDQTKKGNLVKFIQRIITPSKKNGNNNLNSRDFGLNLTKLAQKSNNNRLNLNPKACLTEETTSMLLNCNEECIQLKNISNSLGFSSLTNQKGNQIASPTKVTSNVLNNHAHGNNVHSPSNKVSVDRLVSAGTKSPTNFDEFYSKVGNRLGNIRT